MPALERICRTCTAHFEFPEDAATVQCPFCGTVNGSPKAVSALNGLSRATQQRLRCDFLNAVDSYQQTLRESPEEHEALWGLALCRYGVEYVNDPRTGRRMPTVHYVRRKPMQLDPDYRAALDCAPEAVRGQYEIEAKYIDDVMAKIIDLSETCPAFDVFLCHKTTKPGSADKTEDYSRAFKLYHELAMQGYKVFFAPEKMADVAAGSDYEAAIYHALETAKVMLVVCSDAEYLNSPWVRSEWMRFLEMAHEQGGKGLLPLMYGGFRAEQLPDELRMSRMEALHMEDLGSWEKVQRAVCRLAGVPNCGPEAPTPPATEEPKKRGLFQKLKDSAGAALAAAVFDATVIMDPMPPVPGLHPLAAAVAAWNAEEQPEGSAPVYSPETDFEVRPVEGGCEICAYRGHDVRVSIPPVIGGCRVVRIHDDAFPTPSSLTEVIIPEGVTNIGDTTFAWFGKLERVSIPASVTVLNDAAFYACPKLVLDVKADSYAHRFAMEKKLKYTVRE